MCAFKGERLGGSGDAKMSTGRMMDHDGLKLWVNGPGMKHMHFFLCLYRVWSWMHVSAPV